MALEEVSFYNLVGDEINLTNLVNQMIDYYNQKLEVGETRITDFNEGSEIRNLLECYAVGEYAVLEDQTEASKLPFIETSYGEWLDRIGANPFINLPRIQGNEAMGSVTFTLAEAQTNDVVIPTETILIDEDTGLEFVTSTDLIIPIGETTGEVSCTCLTTGADGNSKTGSITIISDANTGLNLELLSVTNTAPFEEGADYEDDDTYRNRLLNNIRADGFGTKGYYINLAESVKNVHDVILTTETGYTAKILVNGFSKPTPDNVLLEVLTKFTDSNNIILGHNFTADKPSYTTANITLNLNVKEEVDDEDLLNNLTAFVNGGSWDRLEFNGLNINESLTLDGVKYCLELMDNVVEVVSMVQSNSSVTEITPSADTPIKLGTVTFNQTTI